MWIVSNGIVEDYFVNVGDMKRTKNIIIKLIPSQTKKGEKRSKKL